MDKAIESKKLIPTGDATAMLPVEKHGKPITVIGTEAIRETFCDGTLQQAVQSRCAPGVTDVVINPDAHIGFGAPIGCVLVSPTHICPGPVGVDIKCSMSLLQLSIPADAVEDRRTRRAIIDAICDRIPSGTGKGQRSAKKSRKVDEALGRRAVVEGASKGVCEGLGIPPGWASRCEDSSRVSHDDTTDALAVRLDRLKRAGKMDRFAGKIE